MYTYKIISFLLLCSLAAAWSCRDADSFLDPQSTHELNEASVFSDSLRTMDFLQSIYSILNTGVGRSGHEYNTFDGSMSDMTDEADTRWPGGHNVLNQVISGTFGTQFYSRTDQIWTFFYRGIRHANIYLKNIPNAPLSPALKARTSLEARFLRAYFYYWLMNHYGGVILMGDEVFSLESPNESIRSTYEACLTYVVSELDAIAPQLPLSYSGINYGRATRGAALALKSRILLYAASPLYNGNGITDDPEVAPLLGFTTADPSRWDAALRAAQDVVDLNQYALYEDNDTRPGNGFYQVFLERVNPEFILSTMLGMNRDIENNTNPPSRNGQFYRFPSQQLVDAFPMKNGLAIWDEHSGYDEDQLYVGRDPRFYYTVIYNGALYWDQRVNAMTPVYTYVGANLDGLKSANVNTGTTTGYYVRKMADETISAGSSANTMRTPPVFRYAETLLNLAEAANETGNADLAMDQLIQLRRRAGIDPGADNRYGIPADPSTDEARHLIRNERFIELAFEEHRYWDIRRWRMDEYDQMYIGGMRITQQAGGSFSHERFDVRTPRYFKLNSYFFPIPQSEIAVNREIKQNPGW